MSIYLIKSADFTRLAEGTRREAQAYAKALNEVHRPAYGTTCQRISRKVAALMEADGTTIQNALAAALHLGAIV